MTEPYGAPTGVAGSSGRCENKLRKPALPWRRKMILGTITVLVGSFIWGQP